MIPIANLDNDLPDQEDTYLDPRLVADLRADYRQPARLDTVDLAIRHAVATRTSDPVLPRWRRQILRLRPHLGVPIAAAAMLIVAGGAYLQAQSPAPVSAQTILRRAETGGLVPNQVAHYTYQITSSTGYDSDAQFWVQASANGEGVRGWESQSSTTPPPLILGPDTPYQQHQSLVSGSSFKGQETLDGSIVDIVYLPVIQPPRHAIGSSQSIASLTAYIDAQSYITRGWDWTMSGGLLAGSTWQMRLIGYDIVPASAAPWHSAGGHVTSGRVSPRTG